MTQLQEDPWEVLRYAYAAATPKPGAAADELETAEIQRDLGEERAAIMEYDGGMPRREAEALAAALHGFPAAFERPDAAAAPTPGPVECAVAAALQRGGRVQA